jgi:Xaa-Pro aminopeptidase
VPHVTTDFGSFLKFETLTLCPIDKVPIDVTMLTADERQWLDNYHEHVYAMLSPHLDDDEKQWLRKATQPLTSKKNNHYA